MLIEVRSPDLAESVQSGTLLAWRKKVGEAVGRDEVLAELETDKVILEVTAPADGVLAEIRAAAGREVRAGEVLALIDAEMAATPPTTPGQSAAEREGQAPSSAPAPREGDASAQGEGQPLTAALSPPPPDAEHAAPPISSGAGYTSARKAGDDGPEGAPFRPSPLSASAAGERQVRREPMSRLRQRIAERLVAAQRTAAILTTFNEIDMQPVQELRRRYQERFQQEHGVKLGLMSFFVKAVCQALKAFPVVNARIDGHDIVYHDFYDIGVAVSSERGLVVPVLRDADRLTFAEIERRIDDFARRANALQLTLEELEGGTFTISNGGVFGSLLSTPLLNPPQSGVLGLHRIQDRPVARDGQVVIRPMMYVALSYDHRLVDGREAVGFLRTVKENLEEPERLLLDL